MSSGYRMYSGTSRWPRGTTYWVGALVQLRADCAGCIFTVLTGELTSF